MKNLDYERLSRQFDVLCEINRELNRRSELKPLLESIAENTARLLEADAVSVMLYDERTRNFRTFAGWKSWPSEESAVIFSANEGIIGQVAANGQGVLVNDPANTPGFIMRPSQDLPPIQSLMCVPLLAGTKGSPRLVGVINSSRRNVPDRPDREAFSLKDLELFTKFADQVTAAIERSEVFEQTRQRTLQLQIINEVMGVISTTLEKAEIFQSALETMVRRLELTYGQLLVGRNGDLAYNFNTLNQNGYVPDYLARRMAGEPASDSIPFARADSASRRCLAMEVTGQCAGYLYLESRDPFFFEDENNRRVVETIGDQFDIALENFRLFQEIRLSKQKLEDLNHTKNELISIVSHDFRSPLTVIHAYSELLMIHPDLDIETRKEYLHSIFEQIGHLRRLADGALKITRIESGEMIYSFEKVTFRSLAGKFSFRHSPNHRLLFQAEASLPAFRADADKLFEILDNLISNAIKYSPGGGDVVIRANQKGDFVEFQVRDHGIGIPANQIGHLFQKYYRVHDDKTKHIRGTGLGLYICRRMVEGHGGRIWVQSKPGRGSVFFFTLPVYVEEPAD